MPSTPGKWIVALPAWGDRCVDVFLRYTMPALSKAIGVLDHPVDLMIWTDGEHNSRIMDAALFWQPIGMVHVSIHQVPGPDHGFGSLSACHREALAAASGEDRVCLLTADMVLSREILATCEQVIAEGKDLVCCVAMRTEEDGDPPIGASGRELLDWGWAHRHRMTRECTWPEGHSYDVWRMYFERNGEAAARVFLPHPLVVVPRERQLTFSPTIDVNLTLNFAQHETHMITVPEEGAVVELSPANKEFVETETMAYRFATGAASSPSFDLCTIDRHRMFFGKKVIIRGTGGDCGDAEVVGRVLG